jgi:hypothetical protein
MRTLRFGKECRKHSRPRFAQSEGQGTGMSRFNPSLVAKNKIKTICFECPVNLDAVSSQRANSREIRGLCANPFA